MIRHYLASAVRNLLRRPVNSAIKLLALALGLTCLLTAHTVGDYFARADRNWANAGRTYVVAQLMARPGGGWDSYFQAASPPIAKYLRADIPELESIARINLAGGGSVRVEGRDQAWYAVGADPEFTDIFDLEMLAGEAALGRPGVVLIDDEVAQAAFGGAQAAIGQPMVMGEDVAVRVAGVFRAFQRPSHLSASGGMRLRVLAPMSDTDTAFGNGAQRRSESENFQDMFFVTYVTLPEDGSLSEAGLAQRLDAFSERRAPDGPQEFRFTAVAMPDVMAKRFNDGVGSALGVAGVPALYLLGVLTLIIGCVNFANLSAAEAANRAKEIGLRKTLGATRRQVAAQMLVESGLLAALAVVLVVPLSFMLATMFGAQFNQDIVLPGPSRLDYWAGVAGIAAAVAVAAGAYPAVILAGLRPAFAIRMGRLAGGAGLVRALLISVQFAAAGFLLVLVLVMAAQINRMRSAIMVPDRGPIVYITMPGAYYMPPAGEDRTLEAVQDRIEAIRQRVLADPAVEDMAFGPNVPFAIRIGMTSEFALSREPGATRVPGQTRPTHLGYFRTLETPLLAGRTFSADRVETESVIIDAATAELLGLTPQEAVGQPLYRVGGEPMIGQTPGSGDYTIIGVVEREPLELRARGPVNYLYTFQPLHSSALVKLSPEGVEAGLAHLRAVWAELFPGAPLDPAFLEDSFDAAQSNYMRINAMFLILAGIALVIAAMGLFGMASFVVQRRVREIGVRKTLGAGTGRVLRLLLWDLSKPVVVANLVAWPFAFIAARIYLENFVTRVSLTPLPFLAALGFTLLIAWAAVAGKAWSAARVMPASVLKYE